MTESKTDSSSEPSDEWLMKKFAEGQDEYFATLYRRYGGRVYGYLKRKLSDQTVAEDIFQEVFLKMTKSRRSFKLDGHFAPWLFSIVRHCMTDAFRRGARQKSILESVALASTSDLSESKNERDIHDVESILESLTVKDRTVLSLRYVEDLSFANVASRMGLSAANVRQIASRAIHKLRKERYEKND
jgi:RNA polymerase sigma-70 factor (ECF subfamily)